MRFWGLKGGSRTTQRTLFALKTTFREFWIFDFLGHFSTTWPWAERVRMPQMTKITPKIKFIAKSGKVVFRANEWRWVVLDHYFCVLRLLKIESGTFLQKVVLHLYAQKEQNRHFRGVTFRPLHCSVALWVHSPGKLGDLCRLVKFEP